MQKNVQKKGVIDNTASVKFRWDAVEIFTEIFESS